MKVKMCDPPSGWKYGFPKPLPADQEHRFHEWLVENGYPKILLDAFGDKFWCRFWVTEEKE
jgi:hypothetical protein